MFSNDFKKGVYKMKDKLRNETIDRLNTLDSDSREKIENELTNKLIKSDLWQTAEVIGITISQPLEWNTEKIIQAAWEENKTVAVPKCDPHLKHLNFYKFTSYDDLEVVYYDLREPKPIAAKEISKQAIELLIVPGLLYNKQGYRIGFGGGFYDRFLEDFKGITLSLAADFQIYDDIPIEVHDIPVDHIFTNKRKVK